MNNNITLLQIFANNNIGELYPVDGPDCFPKFGHICGYDLNSDSSILVGFNHLRGWKKSNITSNFVLLKEYESYWLVPFKF